MMQWEAAARRERRRVVVHEASHCVAAIMRGGSARVSLIITRHPGGLYGFSGLTTQKSAPEHRGFVAAAGAAGEVRYAERAGWSAPPPECVETDLSAVDQATRDDPDALFYPARDGVFSRARAALDDPETWWAVLRLADALMAVWPDAEVARNHDQIGSFVGEMSAAAVSAACAQAGLRA
jgi:hypothetical protein